MNTTQNAPSTAPLWTSMTAGQFDTKAPAVQGSLFAEPDRCGTPDMFSEPEPAPAPVTDVIHLAHVADAITELTGDDDYDAVADQAARLLDRVPSLGAEAARFSGWEIEWDHFKVIVRAALEVPAEAKAHADNGSGLPACGWIQDSEHVTAAPETVTCRFCKDTVNARRYVAELTAARFPLAAFYSDDELPPF